ncbi:MAG: response regulator transcription factor [Synergistaceae bacterium]|nr:response regulator transcription factor [Synergistaceae bacterium]MBR0257864.1 response regulator transcription factor [Synergistaceae bacterium]
MNLNIAVVDDNAQDCADLQRGIQTWLAENHEEAIPVTCFDDGNRLIDSFVPEKFNIFFLDILMNGMNGIEAARRIRLSDNKALIIFTTHSNEYAFEAFPLHVFDYILKPYDDEKIGHVMIEAMKYFDDDEPSATLRVARSEYITPLRYITAVISRDHFVEVVMSGGNCLICSMSFSEIERQLTEDPRFVVCSRGIIINMDCVSSLTPSRDVFIMNDGTYLPVSKRRRADIIRTFTQHQISRIRKGAR